ncbi:MAG: division/cell wall cluster transcriptional repressor MraZ, partial [Rhodothermales bacterium]
MASFKGQAEYSVDSKGRVAIPAKMRNALSPEAKNSFTITRGFEQCINLYPLDQWEKREAEISELNTYRSEAR